MSACSPLMMLCAWVVLPPNDIRKYTTWPSWASFHSDCHAEISLPYAVYGLLYAASVTTGLSDGVQAPPDEAEVEEEHAGAVTATRSTMAGPDRPTNRRCMRSSFRSDRWRCASTRVWGSVS